MRWTPDGRAIAYIREENGVQNIWAEPVNGGSITQLTAFRERGYEIMRFAWSREGSQLAVARRMPKLDVVLIKDTAK